MDTKTLIAKRVGQEFESGDYVNLGIGRHTDHGGQQPLTAMREVDMIVTELAVFQYLPELTLTELAPGVTEDQVRSVTTAKYTISPNLKTMPV